jgi:5-methylcytosine-specific restriction enzyme A
MSILSEIKPEQKERVCDLLERAGIKVPKNKNRFFMSLPAFNQSNIVVINFWYGEQIKQQGDNIVVKWRLPTTKKEPSARMQRVHDAIKSAIEKNLKIRIIILDGKPSPKGSKVFKRSLDPVAWAVTAHDLKTGDCTLTRGADHFVDQFSVEQESPQKPERREVSGQAFIRSPVVRRNVLLRANGNCEWCGESGFAMAGGGIYLETHHVIPLSEEGLDLEKNVAALCPNHHREAHHGANKDEMRKKLLNRLAS